MPAVNSTFLLKRSYHIIYFLREIEIIRNKESHRFKSLRLNCSNIALVNLIIGSLNYYSVVFIKKINLLHLRHWCLPGQSMNFSEEATGGVLWKKLFLQILQYSQESWRPATLLKTDSNTGVFLWRKHLLTELLLLYWLFY